MIAALCIIGVVLVAASIALGARVAARPAGRFDLRVQRMRGRLVPVALFFTKLGRWYGIVGIIYAAFIVAANARTSVVPVLALAFAQILSQGTSALMKLRLRRVRPQTTLGAHEPDFSYPSGHSVTAVVLYGGFAILAAHAPLPTLVTALLSILLVVCAIAVAWSRLDLGAHYASDVAGGVMLGAGWLCLTLAALERWGYGAATAPR